MCIRSLYSYTTGHAFSDLLGESAGVRDALALAFSVEGPAMEGALDAVAHNLTTEAQVRSHVRAEGIQHCSLCQKPTTNIIQYKYYMIQKYASVLRTAQSSPNAMGPPPHLPHYHHHRGEITWGGLSRTDAYKHVQYLLNIIYTYW